MDLPRSDDARAAMHDYNFLRDRNGADGECRCNPLRKSFETRISTASTTLFAGGKLHYPKYPEKGLKRPSKILEQCIPKDMQETEVEKH